jgi:hypothetical protein
MRTGALVMIIGRSSYSRSNFAHLFLSGERAGPRDLNDLIPTRSALQA